MLKLETLIKPLALDDLLEKLVPLGVHSLSYSEIYAANEPLLNAGKEGKRSQDIKFAPHIKLEVIVDAIHLPEIETILADAVASPLVGGAEVTVIPLREGLRVLSGRNDGPEVEEI